MVIIILDSSYRIFHFFILVLICGWIIVIFVYVNIFFFVLFLCMYTYIVYVTMCSFNAFKNICLFYLITQVFVCMSIYVAIWSYMILSLCSMGRAPFGG